MIKKENRFKPYPSHEFIQHLQGTRGKKYFPHHNFAKDRYNECIESLLNPNKSIIVPDNRERNSNYVCMFINKSGENIALPLGINESGQISIITIKNIAESNQNPKWFYEEYNKVASIRDMPLMKKIWRPQNEKY